MTKSEIIADIKSKSLLTGDLRGTGPGMTGEAADISRYNIMATLLDVNEKVYDKEFGFYVFKEGTAEEKAYYVRDDVL